MTKGSISWDNLFTYDSFVHAVAGSVGSMTAMSVFYPLDTIRSRLQVDDNRKAKNSWIMLKEVVEEEGFKSLYRGLEPVLTSLCASGFVYFYTFHGLRAVFYTRNRQHSATSDLILGSLAGVVNVLLTTPFWVVNTRMKMQGIKFAKGDADLTKFPEYHSVFHGLALISRTEGVATLWRGTLPSLVLVTNPAIQFALYEKLKRQFQEILGTTQLNSLTIFLLGAVAKSISTVITYPLQVVQSKLRYGGDDVKNKNMLQILMQIIQRGGYGSLYKGMEAKLLQTVMTTALMYLCYERITVFVFRILKGSTLKNK